MMKSIYGMCVLASIVGLVSCATTPAQQAEDLRLLSANYRPVVKRAPIPPASVVLKVPVGDKQYDQEEEQAELNGLVKIGEASYRAYHLPDGETIKALAGHVGADLVLDSSRLEGRFDGPFLQYLTFWAKRR